MMGTFFAIDIGNGVFPVVNVIAFRHRPLQGAVGFADGILENVPAIHAYGVIGGKPCDLFRCRIEIGDAPFLVRGKKTVGNSVEYFDETFFLLVYAFQRLEIVLVHLIGEKMVPTSRILFPFEFEIGTAQATGQFPKKILSKKIAAMGSRDKPAFGVLSPVGRAQYLGARKQFPARIIRRAILFRSEKDQSGDFRAINSQ